MNLHLTLCFCSAIVTSTSASLLQKHAKKSHIPPHFPPSLPLVLPSAQTTPFPPPPKNQPNKSNSPTNLSPNHPTPIATMTMTITMTITTMTMTTMLSTIKTIDQSPYPTISIAFINISICYMYTYIRNSKATYPPTRTYSIINQINNQSFARALEELILHNRWRNGGVAD